MDEGLAGWCRRWLGAEPVAVLFRAPGPEAVPTLAPSPPWAAWDHDRPGLRPLPDDHDGDLDDHPGPAWLDRVAAAVRARLAALRLPPPVPTWTASPPRSPSAPQGPAWGWRRARSLAVELRVAGRLVLVGVIVSVNVGTPREISWRGQTVRTAIWKDPVPGRVGVRGTSVDGDEQGNPEAHGGYDKALYAYAAEDYRWWGGELGRDLGPGTFGENLTVRGIDVSGAVVGERWRAGGTLLEVSSPRTPCYKLGYRMGDQGFVRRFAGAGRPGAYLRILAEGEVAAGDPVEVVHRPAHGLTVAEVSRIYHHDHAAADRLLGVPELAGTWKDWAEKFATSAGRS